MNSTDLDVTKAAERIDRTIFDLRGNTPPSVIRPIIAIIINEEVVKPIEEEHQREHDLVRRQRAELHQAGLITEVEYVRLASEKGAVGRLVGYDTLTRERDELVGVLQNVLDTCFGKDWIPCNSAMEQARTLLERFEGKK